MKISISPKVKRNVTKTAIIFFLMWLIPAASVSFFYWDTYYLRLPMSDWEGGMRASWLAMGAIFSLIWIM